MLARRSLLALLGFAPAAPLMGQGSSVLGCAPMFPSVKCTPSQSRDSSGDLLRLKKLGLISDHEYRMAIYFDHYGSPLPFRVTIENYKSFSPAAKARLCREIEIDTAVQRAEKRDGFPKMYDLLEKFKDHLND